MSFASFSGGAGRRGLNAQVRRELLQLLAQRVLTPEQTRALLERYPVGAWDLVSLVRWFTLLGAVGMAVGFAILLPRWIDLHHLAEGGLTLATLGLIGGGVALRRRFQLARTGRALELLGAFALEALSVVIAHYHATGSHDWPRLVGLNTLALLALAYGLRNPLVLIDAVANGYVWFGGASGYDGGVYWLSMTYPVRYLAAGVGVALFGVLHARVASRWQALSAVWLHAGLLAVNLALWFLALFGDFTQYASYLSWDEQAGQRFGFSLLWALVSSGLLWLGLANRVRMLRGYGWTFLCINAFSAYCQFVAVNAPELWFAHLLVLGGALVGLGFWIERSRRAAAPTG